jgi:hypothetical protein
LLLDILLLISPAKDKNRQEIVEAVGGPSAGNVGLHFVGNLFPHSERRHSGDRLHRLDPLEGRVDGTVGDCLTEQAGVLGIGPLGKGKDMN